MQILFECRKKCVVVVKSIRRVNGQQSRISYQSCVSEVNYYIGQYIFISQFKLHLKDTKNEK